MRAPHLTVEQWNGEEWVRTSDSVTGYVVLPCGCGARYRVRVADPGATRAPLPSDVERKRELDDELRRAAVALIRQVMTAGSPAANPNGEHLASAWLSGAIRRTVIDAIARERETAAT